MYRSWQIRGSRHRRRPLRPQHEHRSAAVTRRTREALRGVGCVPATTNLERVRQPTWLHQPGWEPRRRAGEMPGAYHSELWKKSWTAAEVEAAGASVACGCAVLPAKHCGGGGGAWNQTDECARSQACSARVGRPHLVVHGARPPHLLDRIYLRCVARPVQRKRTSSTSRSSSSARRCSSKILRCAHALARLFRLRACLR